MTRTDEQPLLIHVGLHKTGTAWLQKRVFCERRFGFCVPWPRGREFGVLHFAHAPPIEFDADATRRAFQPFRDQARRDALVPVLSHERLSGHPIDGIYDVAAIANRLAATFPEARVLVTIREQRSMLVSLYREYVRERGTGPIELFLERDDFGERFYQRCRRHHLEYDRIIRYYHRRWSDDQVTVVPYELMKHRPADYAARIAGIYGTPCETYPFQERVNVGLKGPQLLLTEKVNRNVPPRWNRLAQRLAGRLANSRMVPLRRKGERAEKEIHEFVKRYVGTYYDESNLRTQRLIGLDLHQLGYSVAESLQGPHKPVRPTRPGPAGSP